MSQFLEFQAFDYWSQRCPKIVACQNVCINGTCKKNIVGILGTSFCHLNFAQFGWGNWPLRHFTLSSSLLIFLCAVIMQLKFNNWYFGWCLLIWVCLIDVDLGFSEHFCINAEYSVKIRQTHRTIDNFHWFFAQCSPLAYYLLDTDEVLWSLLPIFMTHIVVNFIDRLPT